MIRTILFAMFLFLFFPSKAQLHMSLRDLENYPGLEYANVYSDDSAKKISEKVQVLYYRYNSLYDGIQKPDFRQLASYPNLQYLEIQKCFFDTCPAEILRVKNLRVLDLDNNSLLSTIPPGISALTKLEELSMKNCSPYLNLNELSGVTSLRALRISSLNFVPLGMKTLTQLSELEIDNSPGINWQSLIDIIATFPRLKKLILKGNNFSVLPPEIERLKQLEELDISSNAHLKWDTELPRLNSMINLRIVHLENCFEYYTPLPLILGSLKQIESLDLSQNGFTDSWIDVLAKLNLKKLILSDCYVKKLPESISQLNQLEELDLSNNQELVLPNAISQLIHLYSLDVSYYDEANYINPVNRKEAKPVLNKQIVEALSHVPLAILKLEGRNCELPSNIGKLISLKELNISKGNYEIIPKNAGKLVNLEILHLKGLQHVQNFPPNDHAPEMSYSTSSFNIEKSEKTLSCLKKLKVLDMRQSTLENKDSALTTLNTLLPGCKVIL